MSDRAFPIISVRDLPATRAFYETLGFSQTYQFPREGEPGFVTMARGTSSIGIGAGGAADDNHFGYWVHVDDVDVALEQLCAAGAPFVAAPEDQPWGARVAPVLVLADEPRAASFGCAFEQGPVDVEEIVWRTGATGG